ncbi:hypothetical protein NEFER03_1628 [Nematocida sp. LUAm3]|nr:hypothetical protein NEFER03_1628 [Nematocida sp. LUAm3]KAI5176112.1 hypothetical protein NEFER02_1933 [Nematocida sp. LUAm2]KAI5179000.1 hypothetical protein NEFER01_1876 [Nematocida sp. LUAm1]
MGMKKTLTQIIVGYPPNGVVPFIQVYTGKEIHTYTVDSYIGGRQSVISDEMYWLVFTGGIALGESNSVCIIGEKKHSVTVTGSIEKGITRYLQKQIEYEYLLPSEMFLDLVIEEEEEKVKKEEKKKKVLEIPRVGGGISFIPPPGGLFSFEKPSVACDLEKRSRFPRIKWNPSMSVRGSIYDKKNMYFDEKIWIRLEKDFIEKFCIMRSEAEKEIKNYSEIKNSSNSVIAKEKILSERQEFLLSVICSVLKKKKLDLEIIGEEVYRWADGRSELVYKEEITSLGGIFPMERECNKILRSGASELSSIEKVVKKMLEKNFTQGMIIVAKFFIWAEPSIKTLKEILLEYHGYVEWVRKDKMLPGVLLYALGLGNLVNVKYAGSLTSRNSETKALFLSSIQGFDICKTRCFGGDREISLLEYLIVELKETINFSEIINRYRMLEKIDCSMVNEQILQIKRGLDVSLESGDFSRKNIILEGISASLREIEDLFSSLSSKLVEIAKTYSDTPDGFIPNVSIVLKCLEKHSCHFVE